jgi:oxalate decarboxylase/phosphoglucose isomerase-like protein (cupin superfamily)
MQDSCVKFYEYFLSRYEAMKTPTIKMSAILALLFASTGAFSASLYKDLSSSYQGNDQLSDSPKVKSFLAKEGTVLNGPFPYRMNIFTQGSTQKNDAGVRVSEDAKQIKQNTFGQVFYYELFPSAMRVPHWHANGNEVGTVTSGRMRVEIWEKNDKPSIYYVEPGQTWFIPKGKLHSLENVGQDQLKFIVVYDQPVTADRDFVTAWASLSDAVLAKSVGLTEADISHIKKTTFNKLSNFEQKIQLEPENDPRRYKSDLNTIKPMVSSDSGSIVRLDGAINKNLGKTALQKTVLNPGAMRVPHWYLSGDVLLYVNNGVGYFTMMDDDGVVYHRLVRRGDLVSVPVGQFSGYINVGKEKLEVYEAFFNLGETGEITLLSGSQEFNDDILRGTTGISQDAANRLKAQPKQDMVVPFFD